jgi:hypothetical protein
MYYQISILVFLNLLNQFLAMGVPTSFSHSYYFLDSFWILFFIIYIIYLFIFIFVIFLFFVWESKNG